MAEIFQPGAGMRKLAFGITFFLTYNVRILWRHLVLPVATG